ncbi:MAG: STAS domain-containing protein [Eubacterium sp.]|nr:STAS domain-containing protein [Eubacterium sp.]
MTITNERNNEQLTIAIEGRLDTTTAPQLEQFLGENTDGIKDVILDMEKLEYISSAGLRVILGAHKKMSKIGSMKLIHVCDDVMEVFEMTGFADILDIE